MQPFGTIERRSQVTSGTNAGVSRPFSRFLLSSVYGHIIFVVVAFIAGAISFSSKSKPSNEVLVDFTVAVPPPPPATQVESENEPPQQQAEVKEPEPPPQPDPDPIVIPEKPKPQPSPPKQKKEIKVSKKIVRGAPTTSQPPKVVPKVPVKATKFSETSKLSPEDVAKLLAAGARPSDHTSIPESETARCEFMIRDALYRAWIRPDSSAISHRNPEIEIGLAPGGVVRSVRLVTSSGNSVLDNSVLDAARAVKRFENLTSRYISQNSTVRVNFELKGI